MTELASRTSSTAPRRRCSLVWVRVERSGVWALRLGLRSRACSVAYGHAMDVLLHCFKLHK